MKTLAKIAVVAAIALQPFGSPVVAAGGQQEEATAFYSDASKTTVVGWTIIYCDGSFTHVGSYSIYSETTYYGCN